MKRGQAGFTLIELLIAMAITSVLSVLAYQGVQAVVKNNDSIEVHQDRTLELQRTLWWLEQDIIQMAPRAIEDGLGGKIAAFFYRDDLGLELTRFSETLSPYGSGGLVRVGYEIDGDVLYRKIWSSIDRVPGLEPVRTQILQEVSAFQVRFLSAEGQWTSIWPATTSQDKPDTLVTRPQAVEVQIRLKDLGTVTRLFRGVDVSLWVPNVVTDSEEVVQ